MDKEWGIKMSWVSDNATTKEEALDELLASIADGNYDYKSLLEQVEQV